ncbi:hypothetical protein O7623_20765 [Solwaraspora sp. WMMD791]|nr:hypothetical protein [Solwaraspora sp. WMMD791]WFE25786.1 hypothetical protein O7623_20765 [Solwaraspora sp. WMMD791]
MSLIRLFDVLIEPVTARRYVGRHRAVVAGTSFLTGQLHLA